MREDSFAIGGCYEKSNFVFNRNAPIDRMWEKGKYHPAGSG